MSKNDKSVFVYSTLSNANTYMNHKPGGADLPLNDGEGVTIAGTAGIPNKHGAVQAGTLTRITPEELAYCRENEVFKVHEKNGFIMIRDKAVDVEVAAADMESRDPSSPVVPEDFTAAGLEPPKVAAAEEPRTNGRRA